MVLGERGCEQSFLDAAAIGCRMKGLVYAATLFPAGSVGLEKKLGQRVEHWKLEWDRQLQEILLLYTFKSLNWNKKVLSFVEKFRE